MTGVVLLSLALAQEPRPPARLVCSLTPVNRSGDLEIRIENPSPDALSEPVVAELVLARAGSSSSGDLLAPKRSYRAGLDLSGPAPRASAGRLDIPSRGFKKWRLRATDLPWHRKVSATRSGNGGFLSVVPPGQYELHLELDHPSSGGWACGALKMTVGPGGDVVVQEEQSK